MKDFFSIEYFKELKTLIFLEILIFLLLSLLISINKYEVQFFNLPALCTSLVIWILCCILDKPKYFNLATLITTSPVTYFVFWFMYNMFK